MLAQEKLTQSIIGAAIEVHKVLGPGLLESAYESCLANELARAGLPFARQLQLPIQYKNELIDCGYRIDFLVGDLVIVELKSVEHTAPIHVAQLMTYMRLARKSIGLLINFNVTKLADGITRRIM